MLILPDESHFRPSIALRWYLPINAIDGEKIKQEKYVRIHCSNIFTSTVDILRQHARVYVQ